MVFVCDNLDALSGIVLPLAAYASVAAAGLVAAGYMIGQVTSNPKVTLWAKTEIFQLLISIAFAALVWMIIGGVCSFNFASVGALFGLDTGSEGGLSLFEAAEGYFSESGTYIRSVFRASRYHLSAYNILQLRTLWRCDPNPVLNILFCIFGSALGMGGGSGNSAAPESGYAFAAGAMNLAFNSLLFSYLSVLNYQFILNYIYSGLVFFFLPLGIFLRSMPFLRGLGSLLMALSLAFLIVYPSVLALFYLDLSTMRVLNPPFSSDMEGYVNNEGRLEDVGSFLSGDYFDTELAEDMFGSDSKGAEFEILKYTGHAFLLGVFVPSLAMLAAIGSVMYLNRFLGQEIDLSRIVQMV